MRMKKSDIVVINTPSEICAGTRGSSLGFDALKVAEWKGDKEVLEGLEVRTVSVSNDALYHADDHPNAHRIQHLATVLEGMGEEMIRVIREGMFPLMIGADHSLGAGSIAGLRRAYPNKRIGVVWIDAHADLHTPYTTPSGNVHGMPLSISLAEDNLELRRNDPSQDTVYHWEKLKMLWNEAPKIRPEDIVFYGVRDVEKEEIAIMERHGMPNVTVQDLRERGMAAAIQQASQRLKDCDIVHVSFDVDSMDPDMVSHGTGTPVPHGFSPEECTGLINGLVEALPVACLEVVEINPTLDEKKNKMAETTLDILHKVLRD